MADGKVEYEVRVDTQGVSKDLDDAEKKIKKASQKGEDSVKKSTNESEKAIKEGVKNSEESIKKGTDEAAKSSASLKDVVSNLGEAFSAMGEIAGTSFSAAIS